MFAFSRFLRYVASIRLVIAFSLFSAMSTMAISGPCTLPTSISISSIILGSTSQYVNGQLVQAGPSANYYAQNCTDGGSPEKTQWINFKFITSNYFGSGGSGGVGDHIPFQLRSVFDINSNGQVIAHLFRGPIFHKNWGLLGEFSDTFVNPNNVQCQTTTGSSPCNGYSSPRVNSMPLSDSVEYTVTAQANKNGVAYWVSDSLGNLASSYYQESASPLDLSNMMGFGVAVLCPGTGSCDGRNFSVNIYNISGGWF